MRLIVQHVLDAIHVVVDVLLVSLLVPYVVYTLQWPYYAFTVITRRAVVHRSEEVCPCTHVCYAYLAHAHCRSNYPLVIYKCQSSTMQ